MLILVPRVAFQFGFAVVLSAFFALPCWSDDSSNQDQTSTSSRRRQSTSGSETSSTPAPVVSGSRPAPVVSSTDAAKKDAPQPTRTNGARTVRLPAPIINNSSRRRPGVAEPPTGGAAPIVQPGTTNPANRGSEPGVSRSPAFRPAPIVTGVDQPEGDSPVPPTIEPTRPEQPSRPQGSGLLNQLFPTRRPNSEPDSDSVPESNREADTQPPARPQGSGLLNQLFPSRRPNVDPSNAPAADVVPESNREAESQPPARAQGGLLNRLFPSGQSTAQPSNEPNVEDATEPEREMDAPVETPRRSQGLLPGLLPSIFPFGGSNNDNANNNAENAEANTPRRAPSRSRVRPGAPSSVRNRRYNQMRTAPRTQPSNRSTTSEPGTELESDRTPTRVIPERVNTEPETVDGSAAPIEVRPFYSRDPAPEYTAPADRTPAEVHTERVQPEASLESQPADRELPPSQPLRTRRRPVDIPPSSLRSNRIDPIPTSPEPPSGTRLPDDLQIPPAQDPAEDVAFDAGEMEAVRTSSFQAITPGKTSLTELKDTLGEPEEKDESVWIYQIGPFPRVEMLTGDEMVQAIVIHLDRPTTIRTVENELQLTALKPSDVRDNRGGVLGAVYPERGIVLRYGTETEPRAVSQIMLEPVNAELFMVRARNHPDMQIQLGDLRYARNMDDRLAESYDLEAEIQQRLGRLVAAKESLERGLAIESDGRRAIELAKVRWRLGERGVARRAVQKIARDETQPELVIAAAQCALGDFAANGKDHDFTAAFKNHMKALQIAGKFVDDQEQATRVEAKQILVDAHLGVAGDLAWGEWRQKEQAVPKWASIAKKATDSLVDTENQPKHLQLDYYRRALTAYSAFAEELGQAELADEALQLGRSLISKAVDPLQKRALQWQLIETLYFGSRCMQRQRKFDEAIQLAETAAGLIDSIEGAPLTTKQRYLAGRVLFQVGSVMAINHKEHRDAIAWYERTLPYFERVDRQLEGSLGAIGDRMVSMGVSFWKSNRRTQAIEVTQRGAQLLEQAVDNGHRNPESMAIPYSNLVSMYEALGDQDKASEYARKAELVEAAEAARRDGPIRR